MEIEDILETAKISLKESGSYTPMAFIETEKKETVVAVLLFDDDQKITAIDALAALVKLHNSERYIVVFEAWRHEQKKNEYPFAAPPSKMKDRKECLLATEFKKPNILKTIMVPFEHVKNTIKFGKSITADDTAQSRWNVFIEREVYDERMNKESKEAREKFLRDRSKYYAKKYQKKFMNKDGTRKTSEECDKIVIEMMEEMKAEWKKHSNTIREEEKTNEKNK